MVFRKLLVGAIALASIAAYCEWAALNSNIPIERLIKVSEAKHKANPKDAVPLYHLGRLHSLLFSSTSTVTDIYYRDDDQVFAFPPFRSVRVKRNGDKPLTSSETKELIMSLDYYGQAVKADPEQPLFRFGLAWMHMEASPYAAQLKWKGAPGDKSSNAYLKSALNLYREVYALAKPKDLASGSFMLGIADSMLSRETGRIILDLATKPGMGGLKSGEKEDIEKTIDTIQKMPQVITPIIFPVRGGSFDTLINPSASTTFDFTGFKDGKEFPWVTSQAGILVWDPENKGKITSGRQLFGSTTFWMFFDNGYSALASLDDDQNGWLEGRELKGIAVWIDQNENAISEPGEVKGVEIHGITRINTMMGDTFAGMPLQLNGIHLKSGDIIPTYDWTPVSH